MEDLRPGTRGARRLGRRVGDEGNRSGRDGLIDKPIAVAGLALHSDKNRSGAHSPGIVFHSGNGRVPALEENLGALQELVKCHWSDYSDKELRRYGHRVQPNKPKVSALLSVLMLLRLRVFNIDLFGGRKREFPCANDLNSNACRKSPDVLIVGVDWISFVRPRYGDNLTIAPELFPCTLRSSSLGS